MEIRILQPDVPILISSGLPEFEELPCFQQPHIAVISKPFSKNEILIKLAQVSLKSENGSE